MTTILDWIFGKLGELANATIVMPDGTTRRVTSNTAGIWSPYRTDS